MKKSDLIIALVIGELIALFSFSIFKNMEVQIEWLYWIWPVFMPIFCAGCLWFASVLAKKLSFIWQLAKFVLVGVLNTLIDIGILNFLMLVTGIASGTFYSIFKGFSFIVSVVNSYFWNKHWTFGKKTEKTKTEFIQFFIVSVIGFGINVSSASIIVNIIGPQFGLSPAIWANVGAIGAAFCGMTWNFLGYKFIVFK
ncbi:GtrA family protein [Candidatus Parcubacteria bacterium]|nr:GtrA family protein [Candidatus Parcubacteria bacterium]